MISLQDIKDNSMFIGDTDISDYGVLVESFKVGATKVDSQVYQGFNRTNFNVLSSEWSMRPITVSLFYSAKTRRELSLIKAKIDAMLYGKLDLYLPDNFFYFAYLESAGEEQIMGVEDNQVIALCSYSFNGIRHDPLEKVELPAGEVMQCKSTMPKTDCRLICTASENYASMQIGPVTITDVTQGDVLEVDGILGRILQNGAPCAGNMSFVHLPYLVPGSNEITCPEDLTVEYYPTY